MRGLILYGRGGSQGEIVSYSPPDSTGIARQSTGCTRVLGVFFMLAFFHGFFIAPKCRRLEVRAILLMALSHALILVCFPYAPSVYRFVRVAVELQLRNGRKIKKKNAMLYAMALVL